MVVTNVGSAAQPVMRVRNRFYLAMALAMSAVVLVGFGPSFYVNAYFGDAFGSPPVTSLSTIIVLHGLVFSAWMVLLVVQAGFVARAKLKWHRRLGALGGVLAAAMVVLGVTTQIESVRRDLATVAFEELPPFVRGAIFGGFASMLLFAALMGAAIYWRQRPETHKRLILLATITVLGAATARVARILGAAVPGLGSFPFLGLVLTDLFLVALAVNDVRTRKRLHPATVGGGLALLAMQALSNSAVPHGAAVRQLVQALAG
jgi:hypothetical protein